jgi:CRISPR-associated endonuclease/helicase Cas3
MDYNTQDNNTVYGLLSVNKQAQAAYCARKDKQHLQPPVMISAIRSAADAFYVIERGKTEVIIKKYDQCEQLLEDYIRAQSIPDKRKLLRALGKYSVTLYPHQYHELYKRGAVDDLNFLGLKVLCGFYSDSFGIDIESVPEFLGV